LEVLACYGKGNDLDGNGHDSERKAAIEKPSEAVFVRPLRLPIAMHIRDFIAHRRALQVAAKI
jgi:hypothetical protein